MRVGKGVGSTYYVCRYHIVFVDIKKFKRSAEICLAHLSYEKDTTPQAVCAAEKQAVCLTPVSVKKTLLRINPRKAAGPDKTPGRDLKNCAEELKDVLTDSFNTLVSQAVVPKCFKATTIIPVPDKPHTSSHNDYRPIALTPIIMKCFDRLVMQHIKSILPPIPRPIPVCIQNQQVHGRCHHSRSPSSPYTPGLQRLANAFPGF
ncbi:hypothetical protein QTP86_003198 [Hemibagrus guttatus]|nr:hypothetical protein QTP86_003198 [Hemibagrus guttatus]